VDRGAEQRRGRAVAAGPAPACSCVTSRERSFLAHDPGRENSHTGRTDPPGSDRITEQRERVEAAFTNGLSNARVEQINTQIRLIIRRGFGYHSPHAVIALAMLSLGGLCPPLPGR
jgi:hypothetical protein